MAMAGAVLQFDDDPIDGQDHGRPGAGGAT
jgi:hypothetical protein